MFSRLQHLPRAIQTGQHLRFESPYVHVCEERWDSNVDFDVREVW